MDAKDLRNVALLGHSGSGKTSLGEAALFTTKATTRLGTIGDGNTVSDFEPEEVKRGGSIQMTLLSINEDGSKINFLDTPGYDDDCSLNYPEGAYNFAQEVVVTRRVQKVDLGAIFEDRKQRRLDAASPFHFLGFKV